MIDLLALNPLLQPATTVSTNSSAPFELDFSALLTELVGSFQEQPAFPATSEQQPAPPPKLGGAVLEAPTTSVPALDAAQQLPDGAAIPATPANPAQKLPPLNIPSEIAALVAPEFLQDLKKFEITIQQQVVKPNEIQPAKASPQAVVAQVKMEQGPQLPQDVEIPAPDALTSGDPLPFVERLTNVSPKPLESPSEPPVEVEIPAPDALTSGDPLPFVEHLTNVSPKPLESPSEPLVAAPEAVSAPPEPAKPYVITSDAIANIRQTVLPPREITVQPEIVKPAEVQLEKAPTEAVVAEVSVPEQAPKLPVAAAPPAPPALTTVDPQPLIECVTNVCPKPLESPSEPGVAALSPHATVDEVKQPELTTHGETPRAAELEPPEQAKQALITSDAIANIRQTVLPSRVIPIPKVVVEFKSQDRVKNETRVAAPNDATAAGSMVQFADPQRGRDNIEEPRPAQFVEIPDIPKLQIVRTVAMEVGDADSQVLIRIEDRGGGISLHFGAGTETLHRSLESSVESLVHAMRRENIEISNVEVSRKSPIDKVRRMKEAR